MKYERRAAWTHRANTRALRSYRMDEEAREARVERLAARDEEKLTEAGWLEALLAADEDDEDDAPPALRVALRPV